MTDSKLSGLNKQALLAIDNPNLFYRIEECVLNARTELAKRRLIRATVILSTFRTIDNELKAMAGWS